MYIRPCSLSFSEAPSFLTAGSPLRGYELHSDSDYVFEIDGRGQLIRKDRFSGSRWISSDLTGSFTVAHLPRFSTSTLVYLLFVVCGKISHMQVVANKVSEPLITGDWCWSLEDFEVDEAAKIVCKTYTGCMSLIQQAESQIGFKTGEPKLDMMLGMALCRPALLGGKSPRLALESLEDYQLRAVSQWHKATMAELAS